MAAKILRLKCLQNTQTKNVFVFKYKYLNRVKYNNFRTVFWENFIKQSETGKKWRRPWRMAFGVSGCFALIPSVYAERQSSENIRKNFNFIADVVEKVSSAVVCIEIENLRIFGGVALNGSGFIVKDNGLILTNAHVVMNRMNSKVQIRLQDGRVFPGVVEDLDVKSDLATVRIKADNLPVMKLGSSSDIRPGEWVIAIGSPFSLSNSVTSGVVSSTHRQSSEIGLANRQMDFIQTDASITFGNSGGPLVNLDGEAIGINCMKIAGNISFAIPVDYAKDFLRKTEERQFNKAQYLKLKYTGVTVFSLPPSLLREVKFGEYHLPEEVNNGLLVGKVVTGSPAFMAGLKTGDVVTHVNSSVVEDINSIYKALETGKPLNITVIRNGKFKEITIIPEDA